MTLPAFDDAGNLPPGRHQATVDDVHEMFVEPFTESHTRRAIFEWWSELRRALELLGPYQAHWLAGSFVTDKNEPNDLDLITVIDGPAYDELPRHRRKLLQAMVAGHVTEQLWRCDNYPLILYPEDDRGHVQSRAAASLWTAHFGTDREGNERGFVEVPA